MTAMWERSGFNPWVGKIPWRRAWQPHSSILLGESHGQRSLMGYSPWDCKESDMTERLGIYIDFKSITSAKTPLLDKVIL